MRTDKLFSRICNFFTNEMLALFGVKFFMYYKYSSKGLKEIEKHPDLLFEPLKEGLPYIIGEVSFYKDEWVYDKLVLEAKMLRFHLKLRVPI